MDVEDSSAVAPEAGPANYAENYPENSTLDGRIFKKKKTLSGLDLFACYKNGEVCDMVLIADNGKK